MNLRIENGRIIDPANNIDKTGTLVIRNGKIAGIEKAKTARRAKGSFDATGMVICPGLVDMHVHLRDPGQEYKEDIESGSLAAVKGGFTTLACMPNTDPINDNPSVTEYMIKKTRRVGLIHLYPIAAISKGSQGKELTEFGVLKRAGAVAFSDDGQPTRAGLMRRALEYASQFDMPILDHCEERDLSRDGVMHEGEVSALLGLKGWPGEAESTIVYRNIQLAAMTQARIHMCHLSTSESVAQVRAGKRAGVRVTAEVAPHHLFLEDRALESFSTNLKVNPPLRSRPHIRSLRQGLKQDVIDAIATDHAPHADFEKQTVFESAPFGLLGLQTALPLGLQLCHEKVLTLKQLISKLTILPARILNIPHGTLTVGSRADVTIFAPSRVWQFRAEDIVSKSHNSPFIGREMRGEVIRTIHNGRVVYSV